MLQLSFKSFFIALVTQKLCALFRPKYDSHHFAMRTIGRLAFVRIVSLLVSPLFASKLSIVYV